MIYNRHLPFELRASRRLVSFIALVFFVLILFSAGVGYFLHIRRFGEMEEDYIRIEEQRIDNILKSEIENLARICHDWAFWDDSWDFMQEGNEEFIVSNLGQETLDGLKLNLMSFVHDNGIVQWQMEMNLDTGKVRSSSEFPTDSFPLTLFSFEPGNPQSGMAIINDRIMLIAYHPVLRGDNTGSPSGFLVIARDLNDSVMTELNEIIQSKFNIFRSGEIREALLKTEYVHLTEKGWVIKKMKSRILSYFTFPVITNRGQSAVIELTLPRTIMILGIKSFIYYIVASILGLSVMGYATIRYIKRNYIQNVKELFEDINRIKIEGDLSYRIPVRSNDEFGQFCRSFNSLLEVIEEQTTELAHKNVTLNEQANRDELTGLYNKRYFAGWLDSYSFQNISNESFISVLMLDIDHFKFYNDRYGHIAGDVCIRNVAELVREVVTRPTDFCIRYGGEEFVLILPDTDCSGGEWIARKILKRVNALKIENRDSPVVPYLTISIGVACGMPENRENMMQLVSRADKALYESKNGGRNQYTIL